MNNGGRTWALVLAAGEGSRLRRLTTTSAGVAIPKQFCSLYGGPSLLHEALQRAEGVSAQEQICTVVAQDHRQWWETALERMPQDNVIVQPENRGTANGILLPLLHIMERDPEARIVLLPSDHHVRDERILIRSLQQAVAEILLVPLTWKPDDVPDSAPKPSRRADLLLQWIVGSDSVFWLALRFARDALIKRVLGTPPSIVMEASSSEQARIDELLHSILPLTSRAAGLRNDAQIASSLTRCDLEAIETPTLVVGVRDCLYGTFAGAQYTAKHIPGARFIGYEHGGHLWVGHHDALLDEVASFAARGMPR